MSGENGVNRDRPLLIVNPHAGGGLTGKTFPAMQSVIESSLGPCDVARTAKSGHAIDLAREAASKGRTLIVAIGGDGTLHEVANGVLDAGSIDTIATRVGFIGQGTGGDFRRTLGIEHRLDRYIAAIASRRERRVDVGKLTYIAQGQTRTRWFLNIVSAGLGGLVDRYVASSGRAFGGSAAYAWASARAVLASRVGDVSLDITRDGSHEKKRLSAYIIAVCNGRYFGGGMHIAPMAECDDGKLEVVSLSAPSKLALTGLSRKIYTGEHVGEPGVTHFACDALSMTLENASARDVFLLDVDGEPLGGLPASIAIVPRALRVCG